jgi:hypothetical protein
MRALFFPGSTMPFPFSQLNLSPFLSVVFAITGLVF